MDKAIGQINWRALGDTVMAEGLPFVVAEYLEDQHVSRDALPPRCGQARRF